MEMSVPHPLPEGPDERYAAYLSEGRICIQKCGDCQRHFFYPRLFCPHCHGSSLTWHEVTGKGVVYATTVIRQRPEKGGPYNLCLVEMEEGVRFPGRVEGPEPEDVKIGMSVAARITQEDGNPLVVFDPS
jgi:uncharacterized OB-fold protein